MNVTVVCCGCGISIERPLSWANQANKKGWKTYCSKDCKDRENVKRVSENCAKCGKSLSISLAVHDNSKSGRFFCSHSCSAQYNNLGVRRHGMFVKKECEECGTLTKNKRFCSRICRKKHGRAKIIEQIEKTGKVEFGVEEHNRHIAKAYLIEKRGRKCEICQGTEWMGTSMPLVLDHKDGNAQNYSVDNLMLVCGNCNMQLSTFAGRNKGKGTRGKKPHV